MKNMLQEIAVFLGGKFALVEKVFATKDSVADVSVRLDAHEENGGIHKTSAQIRGEITEGDIPASIARDQEVRDRIAEHDGSGEAHADLRNGLENLGNGSMVAGRSEYAEKLGTPTDSYTKAQLDARINKHIRNVTYNAATATFVFAFEDGTATEIDTPLESTVKDGRFDAESSELVLVLVSGQEIRIPAAGLVKVYTGQESPTTTIQINSAGEVRADLKQGVVDMVHLSETLRNAINDHLTKTGDTRNNVTTFAEASVRANIVSGETQATVFGKIRKWFSSLGDLAFKNSVTIAEVDALQITLNTKADKSSLGALASKDVVAISEVTNLQSTLDAKANTSSLSSYIPLSQKGANSGVATLDASGKVVTSQLPLGETASTAYRGDRGKIAYDYSQGKRSKGDLDAALQGEINNKINDLDPILRGCLRINPNRSGYSEGIRIASFGNWSNILLAVDPNASDGQIDGQWLIGRNPNAGFTICQSGTETSSAIPSTGLGISPNNGGLYFNNNSVVLNNDPRLSDARPANGGTADYIPCKDTRTIGFSPTPNQIASERLSCFFNSGDVPVSGSWHSILSLKGWTSNYYVWQLASGASTINANNNDLYFRNGVSETWNEWKKIAFSGEAQPASDVSAWAKAAAKPSYNFTEISDAAMIGIDVGTISRTVLHSRLKNGQGYLSRVALGLLNTSSMFSPAILSVGTNDGGTTWVDYTFGVDGRISSPKGTFALTSEIPTSLPANGGNADTVDGYHAAALMPNVFNQATAPTSGMKKGDIWVKS